MARASSLGLYVAICIGLCTWLGTLADAHWQTEWIFTLLGAVFGTAAGFYGLFREVARLSRKDE